MNIKDYMVTTHNGEKVFRSKCIRVKGKFYKREEDAVKIKVNGESKWLAKSDPSVLFDMDLNKYVFFGSANLNGRFLLFDLEGKSVSNNADCRNKEVYIDGYIGFGTNRLVKTLNRCSVSGIYYKNEKPNINSSNLYNNLRYSYEHNSHIFEKFKEPLDLSELNLLNPGYSYGVELETSNGTVPSDKLLENGILPVRDGSTNNYEYVTVPLNNITSLLPIVDCINEHCKFDISTSLHVHIGNVPTDKAFISKFYKFMYNIQDQIFPMFPKYKEDNSLNIKRRNYTQKLPNKVRFRTILNFLNNNSECGQEYTGEMLHHSADRNRTNKWYISSRYFWVNLIPLIFYPSRTIEFRIHQGTLNKYKIIYWLLMCIAFIEYIKNAESNKTVDIGKVFESVYDRRISQALIYHYEDMCNYYKHYNEVTDPRYEKDVIDDYTYVPRIKLF